MSTRLRRRWVRSCSALLAGGAVILLVSACQNLQTLPTTVTDVGEIAVASVVNPPPGTCIGICAYVGFTVSGPPTRPFACLVQVVRSGTTVGSALTSDAPAAGNEAPMQEAATMKLNDQGGSSGLTATVNCVSAQAPAG